MPPIYLTSDLLSYKRKPNLFNPLLRTTATDPYAINTVLNIRGDGLDYGVLSLTPSLLDTNPPAISAVQSKYGGSSLYFDATDSWLSVNDPQLALGTDPFTIEFWSYKTVGTNDGAFTFGTSSSNYSVIGGNITSSGTTYRTIKGVTAFTYPLNQWNHIAVVREGTSTDQTKTYLNGTLELSQTLSDNFTQEFVNIGIYSGSLYCWEGWINAFRITKGVARYTANFDPENDTYLAY